MADQQGQGCLHAGGLVPPLYLHSSINTRYDGGLTEATVEAEWEQRVSQLFRSQVCSCVSMLFHSIMLHISCLGQVPANHIQVHL